MSPEQIEKIRQEQIRQMAEKQVNRKYFTEIFEFNFIYLKTALKRNGAS